MGSFFTPIPLLQGVAGHTPHIEIVYGFNPILIFCVIGIAVIATLWLLAEILN